MLRVSCRKTTIKAWKLVTILSKQNYHNEVTIIFFLFLVWKKISQKKKKEKIKSWSLFTDWCIKDFFSSRKKNWWNSEKKLSLAVCQIYVLGLNFEVFQNHSRSSEECFNEGWWRQRFYQNHKQLQFSIVKQNKRNKCTKLHFISNVQMLWAI